MRSKTNRPDMAWNPAPSLPETWSRAQLVWVKPCVDDGRWPIQRVVGETVEVVAGVIVDGHDKLAVELVYAREGDGDEHVLPMPLRWNDEHVASFVVEELGVYTYRVRAWLDQFGTWQDLFRRRVEGKVGADELRGELLEGAALLRRAARKAGDADARKLLEDYAALFEHGNVEAALQDDVVRLARAWEPRDGLVESQVLGVRVDPVLARCSAWYEFFPRSASDEPGRHATLDEAAERLPRIKDMGFDIVYLPPIHPIGETFRKGKDNAPAAQAGEPGSPWAIGGDEDGRKGGHKSVHPALGGMAAFERFVARADALGLRVALDIAFQTSPDHPYVEDHPEWFRHRPDGTIRYAENPPKKYQDVYPLDFESEHWRALWQELESVFEFWIERGVRIFRVDNPHTKPFAFWEWCIGALRAAHPDVIFLAEAFSRPKIMYALAKLGYNQSYTYFTWRNTKQELIEYCTELFAGDVAEFYRPNFWPNTPDILHEYLVHGGRPAHVIRYVLAATLSSAYGVYGPPYEHVANQQHPLREEYADNEKYEIRAWSWHDPGSLQPLMKRVNRIRRENPALQHMRNIRFHDIDNPELIAYSKTQGDNIVLVIVNIDPYQTQGGWLHLLPEDLGLPADRPYHVHDLLGGERYMWHGARNFVQLDPHVLPAHVFCVERMTRSEKDYEYFM